MHVDPNTKFACWYFSHAPLTDDWPDDTPIADGAFAARRINIKVPDHWKEWLGTLTAGEIEAGGLTLYTVAPSLKESWEQVAEGEMPPWIYISVHRDARLSAEDRALLRQWAQQR